jgi:hypothetical protein
MALGTKSLERCRERESRAFPKIRFDIVGADAEEFAGRERGLQMPMYPWPEEGGGRQCRFTNIGKKMGKKDGHFGYN